MKTRRTAFAAWLSTLLSACADRGASAPTLSDVRAVSPALERYTRGPLLDELWGRVGLSPRDRSIVTLAVLIARNQTIELPRYVDLALDHGVKPGEVSEVITHLAFYAGWANATSAVPIVQRAFHERGIGPDRLPPASGPLLPLDRAAEAQREARVEESFGGIAPGVVHYTTALLFNELWLRPALAPRDRSMVTLAALIANGQVAQVAYHLNRAMDNGLTRAEVSEMMTHLAFYAGWPNVFSALPIVKDVLEKRPS
jgi:4-carboxymuconolactone decarboxylase